MFYKKAFSLALDKVGAFSVILPFEISSNSLNLSHKFTTLPKKKYRVWMPLPMYLKAFELRLCLRFR